MIDIKKLQTFAQGYALGVLYTTPDDELGGVDDWHATMDNDINVFGVDYGAPEGGLTCVVYRGTDYSTNGVLCMFNVMKGERTWD
jgi:hypothetical protein